MGYRGKVTRYFYQKWSVDKLLINGLARARNEKRGTVTVPLERRDVVYRVSV